MKQAEERKEQQVKEASTRRVQVEQTMKQASAVDHGARKESPHKKTTQHVSRQNTHQIDQDG